MQAKDKRGWQMMVGLAIVLTVGIWNLPYPWGYYILWPFTILGTWVHEMGHGMMAAVFGDFHNLVMNPDGSGYARFSMARGANVQKALVAAAGLLGPAVAGAFIIVFGREEKAARGLIGLLGALIGLSVVVYIRSPYGIAAMSAWSIGLVALSWFATDRVCFFTVQFLGVQFCINNFRDFNYMFSRSAGTLGASDTEQIANNLFLPYWFWGGVVAVSSLLLLGGALKIAAADSKS